ncbi:MAG: hypothetical protein MI802_07165, partial [Desulfobacterales bacterium]|nr:hypothetical protein [Desulfobacterales bacterium]
MLRLCNKIYSRVSIKLLLLLLITSGFAVAVVAATLAIANGNTLRDAERESVRSQASIVAMDVAAAVSFQDTAACDDTLTALVAQPNITGATVFLTDGAPFSRQHTAGRSADKL